jgi:predicted XRE-type DNA-binding protein
MAAVSTKTYRAEAVRWDKGWEVHIEGVGVTQSHTLAGTEQAARDYISSLYDLADNADFEVTVVPRLGEIAELVKTAKAKRKEADEANSAAAAAARSVTAKLLANGLSTADAATVLGVTKGRVSQLTSAGPPTKRTSKAAKADPLRLTQKTKALKGRGASTKKSKVTDTNSKVTARASR